MRINSTVSHMSDEQYLHLYLKRTNRFLEYMEYIESTEYSLLQQYGVDIKPYLFTVQSLSTKEFASFLSFCKHYCSDEELGIKDAYLQAVNNAAGKPNTQVLCDILCANDVLMYAVIIIMQYYFL